MASVDLHLNVPYDPQNPAIKSVYEKIQTVMRDKLFSSYWTVFELGQGLRDFKTSDLDCSHEALAQTKALAICHRVQARI